MKPQLAKSCGIVATVLAAIRLVAIGVLNIAILPADLFYGLALIPSGMLLGFVYDSIAKLRGEDTVATTATSTKAEFIPAQEPLNDSSVDKLIRLKAFLDDGIISQEEFDAKKKEILDL